MSDDAKAPRATAEMRTRAIQERRRKAIAADPWKALADELRGSGTHIDGYGGITYNEAEHIIEALRAAVQLELRKMVAGLGLHYDGRRSDVPCRDCRHAERLHEHGEKCMHYDDPRDDFSGCFCRKFELPE